MGFEDAAAALAASAAAVRAHKNVLAAVELLAAEACEAHAAGECDRIERDVRVARGRARRCRPTLDRAQCRAARRGRGRGARALRASNAAAAAALAKRDARATACWSGTDRPGSPGKARLTLHSQLAGHCGPRFTVKVG